MANKQRGFVDVELDGEIRKLRFDANALAEVEDVLGHPINQLDTEDMGIREIRALLWAGLLHTDPKLTLREAGRFLELERVAEISAKISEAFILAFGEDPQKYLGDEKNEESGPNGTGENSNASRSGRLN